MSGTCGPRPTTSSAHSTLGQSLANRWQAKTASLGSILFKMTWKERATPSGRLISALRASARTTSANDSIGWPTPQATDATRWSAETQEAKAARGANAGWTMIDAAVLAGWPTPSAEGSAGEISEDLERVGQKWHNKKTGRVLQTNLATDARMLLLAAPWTTPSHSDAGRGGTGITDQMTGSSLTQQVQMAAWATPARRDYRFPNLLSYKDRGGQAKGEQLNNQVVHSGPTPSGCPAGTASSGLLNAAHSRWLQGCPQAWDDCSPNYNDWLRWQALMLSLSKTPRPTESPDCEDMETPSAPPRQ